MTPPYNEPNQSYPLSVRPGSARMHDARTVPGSRHAEAAAVVPRANAGSSYTDLSLESRATDRSQSSAAAAYTSAEASREVSVSHEPEHEDEEDDESDVDSSRERRDDDDDDDEMKARNHNRAEHTTGIQQLSPQHIPQPTTTNTRSTAPRSQAPSSRPSRSHLDSTQHRGAAAEYYDPANSFRTDDTSSCCSSCTGTTSNNHAHGSTATLLPHPVPYGGNGHSPYPPQPLPYPVNNPDQPPSHGLKPGIIGTAKALQRLHNKDPMYHSDSWERVDLLKRMDGVFNRGITGRLTLLSKHKKNMFLQEAEATTARLRGEGPIRKGEKGHQSGAAGLRVCWLGSDVDPRTVV